MKISSRLASSFITANPADAGAVTTAPSRSPTQATNTVDSFDAGAATPATSAPPQRPVSGPTVSAATLLTQGPAAFAAVAPQTQRAAQATRAEGIDGGTPPTTVSASDIALIFPQARSEDVLRVTNALNAHAAEFGLDLSNPVAVAHFLSQIGAETELRPQRENMNYRTAGRIAETFATPFRADSGVDAGDYVHSPEQLGNYVYSGRMGNDAGEGYFFRGGGLIQTTGRNNYVDLQSAIDAGRFGDLRDSRDASVNVVANPDQINEGELPTLSALHYFEQRVRRTEDGGFPSVRAVTRNVNGGLNGIEHRNELFERALRVLQHSDAGSAE